MGARIKLGNGTSEKPGTVNTYGEKTISVGEKEMDLRVKEIVQRVITDLKIKNGWYEITGIVVKTAKSEQK